MRISLFESLTPSLIHLKRIHATQSHFSSSTQLADVLSELEKKGWGGEDGRNENVRWRKQRTNIYETKRNTISILDINYTAKNNLQKHRWKYTSNQKLRESQQISIIRQEIQKDWRIPKRGHFNYHHAYRRGFRGRWESNVGCNPPRIADLDALSNVLGEITSSQEATGRLLVDENEVCTTFSSKSMESASLMHARSCIVDDTRPGYKTPSKWSNSCWNTRALKPYYQLL